MNLAGFEARHAVVDAAGEFADFRMQRRAARHGHFLETTADAEDRHAARHAGIDERQGNRVALLIIGFMFRVRLHAETARMDIGPRAGESTPSTTSSNASISVIADGPQTSAAARP